MSCTMGAPIFDAIWAPSSLPEGEEEAMTIPCENGAMTVDQDPLSNDEKQSPCNEMTFETPEITEASLLPTPPGHSTVITPPRELAAPTSCSVTGCSPSPLVSAIIVISILSPPKLHSPLHEASKQPSELNLHPRISAQGAFLVVNHANQYSPAILQDRCLNRQYSQSR